MQPDICHRDDFAMQQIHLGSIKQQLLSHLSLVLHLMKKNFLKLYKLVLHGAATQPKLTCQDKRQQQQQQQGISSLPQQTLIRHVLSCKRYAPKC